MWPRLKLTKEETTYNGKYYDGRTNKPGIIRRFYPGYLSITPTVRQDQESFQISRRSRIFALTASGSINQLAIKISTSTGEQYTPDFINLNNLLGSNAWDPRGVEFYNIPIIAMAIPTAFVSMPASLTPYIFEPNICLEPNQTLLISGVPVDPEIQGPFQVNFTFHVWEFPGSPGSPL